jgi:hypothetical protein
MEKKSSEHAVCTKCSSPAIEGTNPPRCAEHDKLQKEGQEEASLRDAEILFTTNIKKV